MKARFERLWQLRRRRVTGDSAAASAATVPDPESVVAGPQGGLVADAQAAANPRALPDPTLSTGTPPEQPVLLLASGERRPVHVGELLPPDRRRWPLSVVRLPAVPKRAILAAGVCAGLAAPAIARHLAVRVLLGGPVARPEGILEVTRIVYTGKLTPQAAAAIGRALSAARR